MTYLFFIVLLPGHILLLEAARETAIIPVRSEDSVGKVVRLEFNRGQDNGIAPRMLSADLLIFFYRCKCLLMQKLCECCMEINLIIHTIKCCVRLRYLKEKQHTIEGKTTCGNSSLANFVATVSEAESKQCYNPKSLPMFVGFCFQMHHISFDFAKRAFNVCSRMEISVFRKVVYKRELGCMNLGGKKNKVIPDPGLDGRRDTVRVNDTLTNIAKKP